MPQVRASAVIIAANAEKTIARCLESLNVFDEVIVYLNNSDDGTREACAGISNVSVVDGTFTGFGPTKNAAANHARNDWIFSIDTDEWLDDGLRHSVETLRLKDPSIAYRVLRKNLFCGRHVSTGGWGNDRLLRLYNRQCARFNDAAVHEKVVMDDGVTVELLAGTLWHDAVTNIDQFLKKISYYSELASAGYVGRRASHPGFALLRSAFAFFRSYVLQLGFVAGWRGLVIAYSRSCGTFYKYVKRYTRSRGLET